MATRAECGLCGASGYVGVNGIHDPGGEWVNKRVLVSEWRGSDLGRVLVCPDC